MAQPPPFADQPRCKGCSLEFSFLKRKHHCRNCGQTFCQGCSSFQIPLPHFGLDAPQRTCAQCYSTVKKQGAGANPSAAAPRTAASNQRQSQSDDEDEDDDHARPGPAVTKAVASTPAKTSTRKCTCGMPLCVCPADDAPSAPVETKAATPSQASAPKPRPAAPVNRQPVAAADSDSTPMFFSSSSAAPSAKDQVQYDLKGDLDEQCREAIKAGDIAGVTLLLKHGANANYVDKTTNTLLHMAAMFNRADIITLLLKHGAKLNVKNASGETAIDLAPPALQYKMQQAAK